MSRTRITVKDKGLKKLIKRIERKNREPIRVKVGVMSDDSAGVEKWTGNISMVELAVIHEFGAGKVPERSFIRSTFQDPMVLSEFNTLTASLSSKIIFGMPVGAALNVLGRWGVAKVKFRIEDRQIKQDLAASTIARKGHDTALIDTGRLLKSVVHKVVK